MARAGIPGNTGHGQGLRRAHTPSSEMSARFQPPTEEAIRRGAEQVAAAVAGAAKQEPFFIGRNGTIETETLYFYVGIRRGTAFQTPYPPRLLDQMQRNAGVFPGTAEALDAWAEEYLRHLSSLTGLAAGWYQPVWHLERTILDAYAPQAFRTPLRSLEPYYSAPALQWPRLLGGRRVAVVSSFARSIRDQLESGRVADIWKGEQAGMLTPAEGTEPIQWSFLRTGYAPVTAMGHAGWPAGIRTWQEAVTAVVDQVVADGAEVALIGCGGLGMLIAGRLRALGISAFVLGGAIQVLFGIKGLRWERHDVISKFWNDAWVWPAEEEMPGGASLIEGGCYWGRTAKLAATRGGGAGGV